MRDKRRIRSFCNRLASAWETFPDWRFGQFMVNFMRWYNRDIFFPEDEKMIGLMEDYVRIMSTPFEDSESSADSKENADGHMSELR